LNKQDFDRNACNAAALTQKVSALWMDVHNWEYLIIFKRVDARPLLGGYLLLKACCNYYTLESSVLKEFPRKFTVSVFFTIATRWSSQLLSVLIPAAGFIL
jgi:hypothetical protein